MPSVDLSHKEGPGPRGALSVRWGGGLQGPDDVKLLFQDPHTGVLRLKVQTPSDLWRLSRLLAPGDRVGAVTTRRDSEAPSDTPAAQRDRRTLFLTVRVERVEFHEFTGHVRVTGPITEESPEGGRYHTLDLEVGADVTVTKSALSPSDRTLLEEGLRNPEEPVLLLVSADTSSSAVVRLKGRSVEIVDERDARGLGKYGRTKASGREKDREGYVEELLKVLAPELARGQGVVVSGPGFFKEELARRLGERFPEWRGRIRVFGTSESGLPGVHELLRSGKAAEALSASVVAQEEATVERLLRSLGEGGLSAVGDGEVSQAVQASAVETLLVLEDRLTERPVQDLVESAHQAQSEVLIVRADGEAGRRLRGLGGVAALLRYPFRAAPSKARSR